MNENELQAYQQQRQTQGALAARVASLLGIVCFIVFIGVDAIIVGTGASFHQLLIARACILLALAGVCYATYTPTLQKPPDLLISLSCIVIGGGVVWVTVLAGGGDCEYQEALFMTFVGFAAIVPWGQRLQGRVLLLACFCMVQAAI